ncbi:phosphatase PAP2 family protein [Marilutibacter maris]|uniref:undecaprenyl-diphosphate phosphatase n=1 Tax=Marilutibacter maris TaxID=1605891 RepID=A0A2U9T7X3_9GAMM|nr:phosphatase PAP2 family protein [Lysobacter maris]AWV07672.1 membrane protein [Lysobacter maris]
MPDPRARDGAPPPSPDAQTSDEGLRHPWRTLGGATAGLVRFVFRHWRRLALAFVGVLLPLWGFAELAEEIHEHGTAGFDEPILRALQQQHGPALDRFFVAISQLGYQYGVVPFDILLVLALSLRRHLREAIFAGLALAGSGLLNVATKLLFARERPDLWLSIAPEHNYSFPSGHAMGSMTLAWVLVLLAWPTRARWWTIAAALSFAWLVGVSRLYLGVHFPTDILAGWAAASLWVVSVYLVAFHGARPWGRTRD